MGLQREENIWFILPLFSVPVWSYHSWLEHKLHCEKQVHAGERRLPISALPWHLQGFLSPYLLMRINIYSKLVAFLQFWTRSLFLKYWLWFFTMSKGWSRPPARNSWPGLHIDCPPRLGALSSFKTGDNILLKFFGDFFIAHIRSTNQNITSPEIGPSRCARNTL